MRRDRNYFTEQEVIDYSSLINDVKSLAKQASNWDRFTRARETLNLAVKDGIEPKRRFGYVWGTMTAFITVNASKTSLRNVLNVGGHGNFGRRGDENVSAVGFANTEANQPPIHPLDGEHEAASLAEAEAAGKPADEDVYQRDLQTDWGPETSDERDWNSGGSGPTVAHKRNVRDVHPLLAAATAQSVWLTSSPVTGRDGVKRNVGDVRVLSWENVAYGDLMSASLHRVSSQDTAAARLMMLALTYDWSGTSYVGGGLSASAAHPRQHRVNNKSVKSLAQSVLRISHCLSDSRSGEPISRCRLVAIVSS